MERARALPNPTQPRLHWPRRRRVEPSPAQPILVPVEHAPAQGVTLTQAMMILVGVCALGGIFTEGAIALVRWAVPA